MIPRVRKRHLSKSDMLELGYATLVDVIRFNPRLARRLVDRLDRAVEDPGVLAGLPEDEARLVAHLANLGLGELLIRAAGKRR